MSDLETLTWQRRGLSLSVSHLTGLPLCAFLDAKTEVRYKVVGDLPGQTYDDGERP